MNEWELYRELTTINESEKRHIKDGPTVLSPRYEMIDYVEIDGKKIYKFKFDSLFVDSNIALNKETRFTFIPEHIHTVIEMLYVFHGQCTTNIMGTPVHMQQGDLCLLDSNVMHSIDYIREEDILISIEMRKEYLSNNILARLGSGGLISNFLADALYFNDAHNQYLLFRNTNEKTRAILLGIMCEYYDKTLCSNQIIDADMVLLFCELLRQYQDMQGHSEEGSLVIEVLKYLEENSMTATLNSTADYFGFHPNYFSTFIKKKTGKSFKELIIGQKMQKACFMLANTDEPIYRISDEIGYNNLGFFYRKFEEIYHCSPQAYRDLNKH